ncbi:MAG: class I SAM-dependent methyltransferase [Phycicoccus sp.]
MTTVFDYDAELRRYQPHLLEAADLAIDARVLDIGCGTGQLTRAAALAASRGYAVGIDSSVTAVTQATSLAARDEIRNATFEVGDAQVHPFPAARFTIGLSRFGTMFFDDPIAALAHLGETLQPDARLVQLVWQASDRQEWRAVIREALGADADDPPMTAAAFSLADPQTARAVLVAAGFADIDLVEVREPVCYGTDADDALEAVRSLGMTTALLRGHDDAAASRALARLHQALGKRADEDGVWFDSAAWLVTARRRDGRRRAAHGR